MIRERVLAGVKAAREQGLLSGWPRAVSDEKIECFPSASKPRRSVEEGRCAATWNICANPVPIPRGREMKRVLQGRWPLR